MKSWRTCLALAASLLVAACASVPLGLVAPEVNLSDVRFISGTLVEQRIGLALRITNPNRRPLEIEGVNFTVDLNGKQFARGVSDRAFTVPALGETVADLSATTTLHEVLRQIGIMGGAQGLEYRISGRLLLGGYGSLPFDRSGRIGMPDPPAGRGRSERF